MKKQNTKNIVTYHSHHLPPDTKTNWKRVDAMTSRELDENAKSDKDTLLANKKFWQSAQLVLSVVQKKERITIRLDEDILIWLRNQGPRYQSRINTILRSCMNAIKGDRHAHRGK